MVEKILGWSFDQRDIWLMRVVLTLFTSIAVGLVLYYQLIPYGPHDEIIKLSLFLGSIPGIAIILAIHRLRTRWNESHV